MGAKRHARRAVEPVSCPAPFTIMLITADDGLERRLSAALAECPHPPRVVRAHPIEAALAQLRGDHAIDAVMLDRHTSGWIDAATCRVVAGAFRAGATIGLIRQDVVLPMHEALAAHLDDTYDRNQVDRHLVRRLKALVARRRAPFGAALAELPGACSRRS